MIKMEGCILSTNREFSRNKIKKISANLEGQFIIQLYLSDLRCFENGAKQ